MFVYLLIYLFYSFDWTDKETFLIQDCECMAAKVETTLHCQFFFACVVDFKK
jgi:hypothetical protein